MLAKSNTPEFGAGAQTFNEVFGVTRNPWNTDLTCSGSSGGSAVALATGMAWLAHGSDLGGSLRTPASFCSVVGLRPSPGVVAHGPDPLPFTDLVVEGPMARTVSDVALLLDAMTGEDEADPLSRPAPATRFLDVLETAPLPRRVAYSPGLGQWPVDPEVRRLTEAAARRFGELGVEVVEASPDFSDAREIFQTLRAVSFAARMAPLLATHRDQLKADLVWNIEAGLALDSEAVGRAMRARGALLHRVRAFFAEHDLLLCPSAVVPPFPVEQRYVERVGDVVFPTYIDWVGITFAITLTGCPALSLPCGFTADDRPVGLQLVGRPRGDAALLAAHRLEAVLGIAGGMPIDPRPPS